MAVRSRARADRSPDFAPPPRYEIRGPIASGGMGTVWSAYDSLLRRKVAIKVLSAAYSQDSRAARRFLREARAAARLSNHPNVVSIYDVGRGDPTTARSAGNPARPFLVMEHLPGETVAHALEAGDIRPQRALRWLTQAAAALDYGHRHAVVHRDIKPHNFLIDAGGDLRIADFGVATIGSAEPLTRTGQLLGTAAYISPEQALGEPASAASDRYALG
jgi:serine/threonine protein kinase